MRLYTPALIVLRVTVGAMIGVSLPPLDAQERITLTTPETKASNTKYRLQRFDVTFNDENTSEDEGRLSIILQGENGEHVGCHYTASTKPTATFLNSPLQKANLASVYAANATTGSLKQRIYHRLIVMGESTAVCGKTLTGTLTGAVP